VNYELPPSLRRYGAELEAAIRHQLEARPRSRFPAIDYRPRRSRGRTLWAAVGVSGTALIAGIATAIVLLSSGAPAAYAGWIPVPTTPTPAAVAAATAACNRLYDLNGPPVLTGRPVLTDARGIYTAAIYVSGEATRVCISAGHRDHSQVGMNRSVLAVNAAPGPDQLSLPATGGGSAQGFSQAWNTPRSATQQSLPGPGASRYLPYDYERHMDGLAGEHVSAVTFVFAGGTTVDATVRNGWYFAWWPGSAYPTSVQVTTAAGTVTSPMRSAQECRSASRGCVFAAGQRVQTSNRAR
jgi:hypothetical protein